jgi:hypothetical protein
VSAALRKPKVSRANLARAAANEPSWAASAPSHQVHAFLLACSLQEPRLCGNGSSRWGVGGEYGGSAWECGLPWGFGRDPPNKEEELPPGGACRCPDREYTATCNVHAVQCAA